MAQPFFSFLAQHKTDICFSRSGRDELEPVADEIRLLHPRPDTFGTEATGPACEATTKFVLSSYYFTKFVKQGNYGKS